MLSADFRMQVSFQPSCLATTRLTISLITYYLTSVLNDMQLGAELSRIIAAVNGTCYFLTS
jgi:hypothetical protein